MVFCECQLMEASGRGGGKLEEYLCMSGTVHLEMLRRPVMSPLSISSGRVLYIAQRVVSITSKKKHNSIKIV